MALPNKLAPNAYSDLPNLRDSDYSVTSEETDGYNCIAWAAGQSDAWWWPSPFAYWPGPDNDASLESFTRTFQQLGFEACDSALLQAGLDKVAIYAKDGLATHAARQLENGSWTSKLGEDCDIEHSTLESLEGGIYGRVAILMSRARDHSSSTAGASPQT
jgi:hypothetical protein